MLRYAPERKPPNFTTQTTPVASSHHPAASDGGCGAGMTLIADGCRDVAQRGGMGPLGLVGFLAAFAGTYLIEVTENFAFLAPVLAK